MRGTILAALLLVAAPAAGQTLLIGNKGEDTVSAVDLASGREVGRVATGRMPHEIAVSPDGARFAVVAYGGNTIDVFDVTTLTLTERIDLGANTRPHGLVWRGDALYATTEGNGALVVVAPEPVAFGARLYAIPTGQQGSHMLALSHDGIAYVANMKSGTVGIMTTDSAARPTNLPAGAEPEGIAVSPDGRRLWVADRTGDVVRVFDTAGRVELARLPTGRMPIRIALTPDGATAYVSNAAAGTLSVYDARTLQPAGTIVVSGKAEAMQVTILLARDGKRLYAAETGTDTIAEVDLTTGTVLRRLPAGKNGDGLAISARTIAR